MWLIQIHHFGAVGGRGELGGGGSTLGHRQPAVPVGLENRERMVIFLSKTKNALFTCKNKGYPKNRTIFSSCQEKLFVETRFSKKNVIR